MTKQKPPDLLLQALERLVAALCAPEAKSNRIEMVEEALVYARVALGKKGEMTEKEREDLFSNLETLGLQIIVDAMDRQDLSLYQATVSFSDTTESAVIVASNHPVIGPLLSSHVEQLVNARNHPDKPKRTFEVN